MEYGASVMEQSHVCATIKTEEDTTATSSAYIDIEIDLKHSKQEPELLQYVKSEPTMSVKKEIAEDSTDDSDQQCVQVASTSAGAGSLFEANSTRQGDSIIAKLPLEEMEIGPTVLQHMDIHYALNKSAVDAYNIAMRCSRVKKNVEDKLRDCITPQGVKKKELIPVLQSYRPGVLEHHLAACSVHVMRLNVFQCDLCHAVYGEKHRLLLHLQAVHEFLPQTSLIIKLRETYKQTVADNKATSHNCGQITTEMDYDETHIESHPGQLEPLKKHLHQQRRTKSNNGFECNRSLHKSHLLSVHNKLHQRNNRKPVTTRDTVAGPSNQSQHTRNKAKQKPFECKVYEIDYSSKVDLNLHKRWHSRVVNYDTHSRKEPYHCDEKFTQSGDLTKNMEVHTGEKSYQCKICDARFSFHSSFSRHVRVHTGEKPFHCTICNGRFALNSNLTKHMRVHTNDKPFQCKICHARFTHSSNLTPHMRIHKGEKPFQCKICDARFAQRNNLTQHIRVHTGEKPFQCKTCNAQFAQNSNLTQHMRLHTGKKLFQCDICGASFAQSSNLIPHMRIHTGEKRFQCKLCDGRFVRSDDLTKHVRTVACKPHKQKNLRK